MAVQITASHPLESVVTSSPRATLQNFLNHTDAVFELLGGEYWHHPSRQLYEQIAAQVGPVLQTLDLSNAPPATRIEIGYDSAAFLYTVLNRIQLPPRGTDTRRRCFR